MQSGPDELHCTGENISFLRGQRLSVTYIVSGKTVD